MERGVVKEGEEPSAFSPNEWTHPTRNDWFPRRSSGDTEGEVRSVLTKLEDTGRDVTLLRILANAPSTFRAVVHMANALMFRSTLPADVREIVIMWMAADRGIAYEWAEHKGIALEAGISERQLIHLKENNLEPQMFTEDQRLALLVAAELLRSHSLDTAIWQDVVGRFGVEGGLELVMTIAWWGAWVPIVVTSLDLDEKDQR